MNVSDATKLTSKFLNRGSNAAGKASLWTKGTVAWGVVDMSMNMAGGDDAGTAALKSGVSTALWATNPGVMWAYTAATTLPQAGVAAYQWYQQQKQWFNMQHMNGQVGGGYQDTQKALTMRQAAVQAIQGSKLNARSALGGEAQILNQNWSRT